jgi:hypothetical protein
LPQANPLLRALERTPQISNFKQHLPCTDDGGRMTFIEPYRRFHLNHCLRSAVGLPQCFGQLPAGIYISRTCLNRLDEILACFLGGPLLHGRNTLPRQYSTGNYRFRDNFSLVAHRHAPHGNQATKNQQSQQGPLRRIFHLASGKVIHEET